MAKTLKGIRNHSPKASKGVFTVVCHIQSQCLSLFQCFPVFWSHQTKGCKKFVSPKGSINKKFLSPLADFGN